MGKPLPFGEVCLGNAGCGYGGGLMQTLLRILERAGGYRTTLYLKTENSPYMALVIEATPEPGPLGLPVISVAHLRQAKRRSHA